MKKTILISMIMAAATFGTAQAESNMLSVSIDRDRLATKKGAESQLALIEGRVKRFCNYREGLSLWEREAERQCVAENMAKMIGTINHYWLTQAFEESEYYAGNYTPQG